MKASIIAKDNNFDLEDFERYLIINKIGKTTFLGDIVLEENFPEIVEAYKKYLMEQEAKKRTDFFARLSKNLDVNKALQNKLTAIFGYGYNANTDVKVREIAESMKYNSFTQLLDPSPLDLYKKYKIKDRLVLEQINRIIDRATHDRVLAAPFNQAITTLGDEIKEQEIIRIYRNGSDEAKRAIFAMFEQFDRLQVKLYETSMLADCAAEFIECSGMREVWEEHKREHLLSVDDADSHEQEE